MARDNWFRRIIMYIKPYKYAFLNTFICVQATAFIGTLYPYLISLMIDEFFTHHNMQFFLFIVVSYFVLFFGAQALYFISIGAWAYVRTRCLFDLRKDMYDKVFLLKALRLNDMLTGDIISRINNDTEELITLINWNITTTFSKLISLVFSLIIVTHFNWKLTIMMVVFIPVLVYLSNYFAKKGSLLNKEFRAQHGKFSAWVFEIIKGMREIKLLSGQKTAASTFSRFQKEILKLDVKSKVLQFKSERVNSFIMLCATLMLYALAAYLALQEEITLGGFVAALEYFNRAKLDFRWLNEVNQKIRHNKAGIERVLELLDEEEEPEDKNYPGINITEGNIVFKNVEFSYNKDVPVLQCLNLVIHHGETISLVGSSGAGKSTVANLLLRLYKPDKGEITIDGQNIWNCSLKSLRKQIGFVQQDVLIFDDTIRNNLRIANAGASDEEIMNACKEACIDDLINSLPEGLDTIVGDGGIGLSGGQRQRLSIARIILKDPKILIFDEATSALDYETEKYVIKSMENLRKGRTAIIIAHRLSTIINSDRIAVIEDGRLVSIGHHSELIKSCSVYQKLFREQYGRGVNMNEKAV